MGRKATDLVLYVAFCILCGTGILLWIAPKGIDWWALGMHEDIWKYAHIASAFIMFAAIIVHLAINRKWIDKVGTSGKKARVLALIILGLLILIIPAIAPVSI
jgi:hypothetical protein